MKKCKEISRKIPHTRSYNIHSQFVSVFSLTKVGKNLLNPHKSVHFQKSAHVGVNLHGFPHCGCVTRSDVKSVLQTVNSRRVHLARFSGESCPR